VTKTDSSWIHTLHHTFHHQEEFLHHQEVVHPLDLQEIVVSAPFRRADCLILIADTDVLLTVMIIIKTIIEVADTEMTTMIATETTVTIAMIEDTIEAMTAMIETMTAMVVLRPATVHLQEVDQDDLCIGNLLGAIFIPCLNVGLIY
jgi:hypothetical protein